MKARNDNRNAKSSCEHTNNFQKENELNCLLVSWNQLFSLVESCEAKYPTILVTLIAPITLLATYSQTTQKSVPYFLVLIVMIITVLVFSYMALLYRYSAMLRGELSRVEERMDTLLGEGIFLWNRCQVNSFLTRGYTFFMMNFTLVLSVLGLVGCGLAILDESNKEWIKELPVWHAGEICQMYNSFNSTYRVHIVSIYLIFLFLDIIGIFVSYSNNTKHLERTSKFPFNLTALKRGRWLDMAQSAIIQSHFKQTKSVSDYILAQNKNRRHLQTKNTHKQ